MGARVGFSAERMKVTHDPFENGFRGALICSRCGGFMVVESCYDFNVLRCVQCGDLVDPVILRNRQHGSPEMRKMNGLSQPRKAA
jgi:hypothetical protein